MKHFLPKVLWVMVFCPNNRKQTRIDSPPPSPRDDSFSLPVTKRNIISYEGTFSLSPISTPVSGDPQIKHSSINKITTLIMISFILMCYNEHPVLSGPGHASRWSCNCNLDDRQSSWLPVRCRDWNTFLIKSVLVWARDLVIDRDGTLQLIPRQSESFWLKISEHGHLLIGLHDPDRWSWQDALQFIPLEAKVEA